MINQENALVSIIVPIYGTEKYLKKCVDSIIKQTYRKLEIILVNDGSPDNSYTIMQEYQRNDVRVKIVNNSENLGLFRARLEGARVSNGDYLMFVDSDDYMGIDFVRLLVNAAESEQADIVKAQFVMEDSSRDYKYVYNYINNRPRLKLEGEKIAEKYFQQEGMDFSWHVVWGKIYSRVLWKKCEKYYRQIKTHLIMTEDIAYSTPLFVFAKKYIEIDCDTYFYVQRNDASTGISRNIKKFEKNIQDLKVAFDFREEFLKKLGLEEKYKEHNLAWKENYGRSWKNSIKWAGFKEDEKLYLEELVRKALNIEHLAERTKEDEYYYSCTTPWSEKEENIKKMISNESIEYISFDIFDTLIVRPFFQPTDLFRLLDVYYRKLKTNSFLDFSKIREVAEVHARNKIKNTGYEEVTLEQIYAQIHEDCNVDVDILKKLQAKECELEIEFCGRRNFGYELYEMAENLGKTIILTSDMYLNADTIKEILKKNGYTSYKELFLSSECNKCKSTGNLYKHIIKKYDCERLIHIGDNYESDYRIPKKFKIYSIHIPKTIDVFKGDYNSKGYFVGNSYFNMIRPFGSVFDNKTSMEFLGIRCMLAMVANKFFDNPFIAFNKESDFNANLYFMSYYALGMHLFSMIMDLIKKNMHRNKIQFVARDGFECKTVYDIVAKYMPNIPKSNYLYLSRKALLPLAFQELSDVYYIKDNISYDSVVLKTPRIILKQFLGMDSVRQELEAYICRAGFDLDNYFKNFETFESFLKIISERADLLEERKEINREIVNKMKEEISENDLLFDIGYNGTAQRILTNLMGRPIDAYYAYVNKDRALVNEALMGCGVQTFYDRTPSISGAIRELMFSKGEASCVGYDIIDEELQPIFEEKKLTYIEKEIYKIINKGVADFTNDYMERFYKYLFVMPIRNYDASLPFEFLMERASDKDRDVFSCCYFEDDIFFGDGKVELSDWWKNYSIQQESREHIFENKKNRDADRLKIAETFYTSNRWKRVMVLALLKPDALKEKMKRLLKKHM